MENTNISTAELIDVLAENGRLQARVDLLEAQAKRDAAVIVDQAERLAKLENECTNEANAEHADFINW